MANSLHDREKKYQSNRNALFSVVTVTLSLEFGVRMFFLCFQKKLHQIIDIDSSRHRNVQSSKR